MHIFCADLMSGKLSSESTNALKQTIFKKVGHGELGNGSRGSVIQWGKVLCDALAMKMTRKSASEAPVFVQTPC